MSAVIGRAIRRKRFGSWFVALAVALALSVLFGVALTALGASAAAAPRDVVYIVDSTMDASDDSPGDGVCQVMGGGCTLRAALEESQFSVDPVAIRFSLGLPATITLGSPLEVQNSVTISGPVTGSLTLDGYGASRHFNILPGGYGTTAISITHLTLINGWSYDDGGSVLVQNSPSQPADVAFDRVVFKDNSAEGRGGALFSDALSVRVIDSLFTGNSAESGGAIANVGGSLRADRSTLIGNEAKAGGALYNEDLGLAGRNGVMTMTVSTLANNVASEHGGALYNRSVSYGAAIWLRGATIVRNRVTSGSPDPVGGGAYNGEKSTLVLNSTIMAANVRGPAATGIWDDCLSLSGGAPAPVLAGASPSSYLTGGDNLVGAGTSAGCPVAGGDIRVDPARLFVDVLDDQLASYDGSQPVFALLPGSPAIDRTRAGTHLCGSGIKVDQRGAPKPLGPACDVGAYEAALPAITVSRTLTFDAANCTGQSALELATGVTVYGCATIANNGNVALTQAMLLDPSSSDPFRLAQPLLPGQSVTITPAQMTSLGGTAVTGDLAGALDGQGMSEWSTPPGVDQQAGGSGESLARPVDVAILVSAEPFGFGAIRTVTATVTYHQTGAVVPQRLVQLTVSGGTTAQLPAQTTNGRGQTTFSYISFSPLTPETGAGGDVRASALAASPLSPAATDFLQVWVDLNGNGLRDPFEPFTAGGVPTAISLASFEAQAAEGGAVLLKWRTASEIDVAGFNVHRATQAEGPFVKVNEGLIPSEGTGLGSEYAYTDHPGATGRYFYKLEEVGTDGSGVMHGPVTVEVSDFAGGGKRRLPPWIAP